MSKIISIGTALPPFRHEQQNIMKFMQNAYALNEVEKRKIRFLYNQSGISSRYSVIPDYSRSVSEWKFYPHSENLEPFPLIEQRMAFYEKYAPPISVDAIRKCITDKIQPQEITHLITVSCTGMSAPGLDLQLVDLLELNRNIFRTSVNFMGCYAAIHAMKIANAICNSEAHALVLIVCTELCTLHFQREATMDNIASSLLFSDGSAAMIMSSEDHPIPGLHIKKFYSEVVPKGKKDMAWELSSTGFLMTLSGYVPELIEEDFNGLLARAFAGTTYGMDNIHHWCIHPGGKKILKSIEKSTGLKEEQLRESYEVLNDYGNMSSATILFVLQKILQRMHSNKAIGQNVFGAAFGPGLTMETFIAGN